MMIIETRELTKIYRHQVAVNHVNLKIAKGSLTALLGPNGAGKTTTMSMLTGLITPSSGQVVRTPGAKLSMVFQDSILDARLTVKQNLVTRSGLYKQLPNERVDQVVAATGLTSFVNQLYGKLSGGQRRRVDIARALLNQPDILFLDEPTTGLDIQTRKAIWKLLKSLLKTQQLTIILTTHYLEEADHADNVYIIDHGQVIANDTATAIKQRYSKNRLSLMTNHPQELLAHLPAELKYQTTPTGIVCWPADATSAITLLAQCSAWLTTFEYSPGNMNDAFLNLTGRKLR